MNVYNKKIGAKLILGFLIIAVITSITGVVGIIYVNKVNNNATTIFENVAEPLEQLTNMIRAFENNRVLLNNLAFETNQDKIQSDMEIVNENRVEIDRLRSEYDKTIVNNKGRVLFDAFDTALEKYNSYIDVIEEHIDDNDKTEIIKHITDEEFLKTEKVLDNAISELVDYKITEGKNQDEESDKLAAKSASTLINIVVIGVISSFLLGIFISISISKPIKSLVNSAIKISEGDFDIDHNIKSKDEVGMLAHAFDKIINALNKVDEDSIRLTEAALEGELDVRADVTKHSGKYRDLIDGINKTLDAIVTPIVEAEEVLEKVAVNDFTVSMESKYKGHYKRFEVAINDVIEHLIALEDAIEQLGKGDFSRLDEYKKLGKLSEKDRLIPSLITTLSSTQDLVKEANRMANATVMGDLNALGDETKYEGGFRQIIQGMNKSMKASEAPLIEALKVFRALSKGDLTITMDGEYQGEYAEMKEVLNSTIESLNELINNINSAAQQVAISSKQISDTAQVLSQGTTEQASSVEELTASLEEISTQTQQNAVNADQANELAMRAKDNAVDGNDQMNEMLSAMNDINEASTNIYKIIKVIDDIAFQTNILALNAAVEAARAGQHGKGFAVVAEEVRNLAARSAEAAKETTTMIESSINKTEGGTKIANRTAAALTKIVEEITKAAKLVSEIDTASNDQAANISQINLGINQVSAVIQTNSATSEESAAASEELSSQAEQLKGLVDEFKLKKKQINNVNGLSQDVLKVLKQMEKENNRAKGEVDNRSDNKAQPIIKLSDSEFGKY